jgi:GTP-binding protein
MKFVDEATIRVEAGRGGDGCMSFRREKYVPMGGPDGGDGGDGASIYLECDPGLNTLIDFRYQRLYRAQAGQRGGGNQRSGRGGTDLIVKVPIGTLVHDAGTGELIGDLTQAGARLLVAEGGAHGIGNVHFKSSVNRSPRQFTKGKPGAARDLRLELRLLADVGLLGMPNAGKSSLLRAVSAARPKVAEYRFSTLHPSLGMVSVGSGRGFVVADIPGLIEGAAQGAGLGTRFLRHLARTRMLLHVLDASEFDPDRDAVQDFNAVERELATYSRSLRDRERWLVLNKIDLLPLERRDARLAQLRAAIDWDGPVHAVSALTGEGCRALTQAIAERLEALAGVARDEDAHDRAT